MRLERLNKLMILLIAEENPLWEKVFVGLPGTSDFNKQFIKAAGISAGTPYNWRNGDPIPMQSADKLLSNLDKHIAKAKLPPETQVEARAALADFKSACHSQTAKVYGAAHILGYTTSAAQKLIDGAIYNRLPLLAHAYYNPDERAEYYNEQFAGVYLVHMPRRDALLQCTLRVRYVERISKGSFIRCKLNIPNQSLRSTKSNVKHWEYDGFLASREWANFWVFEKRGIDREDFFFIVSEVGEHRQEGSEEQSEEIFCFRGDYLTTGQDRNQSRLQGDVFFERRGEQDVDEMESIMHSMCRVLTGDEAAEMMRKLESRFPS